MSEQKLREALEKLVARAKNAREYRDGRWVAFDTGQEEQVLAVPAPESQGVRLTGEMVQDAVGKFGADQPWCNAVARKLNAALTAFPATVAGAESREQKAIRLVKESGKTVHSNTCATSVAPAEEPGPCDCDAVAQCSGYPTCDGDLPGEPHSEGCPARTDADVQLEKHWSESTASTEHLHTGLLPLKWYARAAEGLAKKRMSQKAARMLRACADELTMVAGAAPEPTNWKGVKWRDSIKASNLAQKIALHFAHDCHDSMCGEDANASNCESAWVEDKLSEWLDEMAAPPTTVAGTAPPGVTVQQHDSQWLRDETEVWRQRWMACNAANDMDFYEWAFKTQLTAEATRLAGAAPLMAYCSNPKCDYTFPLPGTTSGIIWACPKCYGNDYHVNSEAPGAYFVSAPDSRLATLLTRLRGLREQWGKKARQFHGRHEYVECADALDTLVRTVEVSPQPAAESESDAT